MCQLSVSPEKETFPIGISIHTCRGARLCELIGSPQNVTTYCHRRYVDPVSLNRLIIPQIQIG